MEEVEIVEVVDAEHVALGAGIWENFGEVVMTVGRGDFDEEMAVADVREISAIEIDKIFAHHRAGGDVAEWLETGDDLIFLRGGSRHRLIIA